MLKKMKLAPKLALVIGTVLTVILVVLIGTTITLSRTAISEATYEELDTISRSNALQIQNIFDAAETVAQNMQLYVEKSYQSAAENPSWTLLPTEAAAMTLCKSSVYGTVLTPINYDMEVFLCAMASNTAAYNKDLAGVGVLFEPYKFQNNMKDYAFYVSEAEAGSDIEPFGEYSDYSKEKYYSMAAAQKQPVVTDPYDYEGVTMVTYASPILYNNELQGVVIGDIKIANFDRVNTTSESFPSMYATIYNEAGVIVYDSEDKADIGKRLEDFTPDADDLARIKNGMSKGVAFHLETTREDGRKVTRYFSPIKAAVLDLSPVQGDVR